jgi:hypothetical protein
MLWRKEGYECYRDYIQNLSVSYRTVVALSELEDLAAGEIAEILGLSPETVKTCQIRSGGHSSEIGISREKESPAMPGSPTYCSNCRKPAAF